MNLRDTIAHMRSNNDELRISREHMNWLMTGRKYTPEAVERVLEVMRRDMLEPDLRQDGSNRARASMLGDKCLRKQQLSFLGAEKKDPPNGLLRIFDIGTFAHYRWQLAGLSAGWLSDIEVPAVTDYGAGGNMDGDTTWGRPFEFKTANGRTYQKVVRSGPLPSHVMQVQPYMEARGADAAHIVYEDKSWDGAFIEFVVRWDPKIARHVRDIADRLAGEPIGPLAECIRRTGTTYNACWYAESCQPNRWVMPASSEGK